MRRQLLPERMDDPALEAESHEAALAGLRRINRISRAESTLWRALRGLCETMPKTPRVLDLASGSGDVPAGIALRARAAGLSMEVAGCDRSARAVEHARAGAGRRGADVSFFVRDVVREGVPAGYDVYTCSLFLHHMAEPQAVALLRGMAQGRALVVHDLERTRTGLVAAWLGTRALSRSPVVHADGPRSVRNAFTRAEALRLAGRAGLDGATARATWPFRWLLEWARA